MESYASGNWMVREGSEEAFVERWSALLDWTKGLPGFDQAHLIRHDGHPQHFVSFAHWKDQDSMFAWQNAPEFVERFQACRELCDDFHGGAFAEAAAVTA